MQRRNISNGQRLRRTFPCELQPVLACRGTAGGVGCLHLKSDLCSRPTHFSVCKYAPSEPLNPNWSLDGGGTAVSLYLLFKTLTVCDSLSDICPCPCPPSCFLCVSLSLCYVK